MRRLYSAHKHRRCDWASEPFTRLIAARSFPSMPNLADLLSRSAAAHADRVAIKTDHRELTYAELDAAAARVAGLLRAKGVAPGDRVGVMLPNVPYFPVCYYGALRAGAAVVP